MHETLLALRDALLILLALSATLPCAYLLFLTLLSGAPPAPLRSTRRLRFDIVVPAHNESAGIARTVTNLLRLDWPREAFRILVVADNCTDSTAEAASAAGAAVLVRNDPQLRGKGYALAYAFDCSRADRRADAVAVVDADSQASANLLEAFAARLERGESAVQAHYGVLNAAAGWRTRLMAIALGSFHMLRSRARERLRVSCGIRGNGWCVTHSLLETVPYRAFSLTEDIEFGVELGLNGRRVAYADEARVDGDMVTGEKAARSQRRRWEDGRFKLIGAKVPQLLRAMVRGRGRVCADLAFDLLVLPLSYVAVCVAAYAAAAAWALPAHPIHVWVALADAAALGAYVLRGWQLSGVGPRGLLDLAGAPAYVAWKILLMVSGRKAQQWIRTDREKP